MHRILSSYKLRQNASLYSSFTQTLVPFSNFSASGTFFWNSQLQFGQVEASFKDLPTLLPSRPQRSRSLVTRQAQKLVERIRACWENSWFQPFLALIRIARIGLCKASPVQWGSLEEVVCCSRTLLMQFISSESYKLSVREQCNLTSTLQTT